jgi:hypothetical protein
MAWTCVRCLKRINKSNSGYAMEYKYLAKKQEVTLELKKVSDLNDSAVIFHVCCMEPEVSGVEERVRSYLRVPKNIYHPLLS